MSLNIHAGCFTCHMKNAHDRAQRSRFEEHGQRLRARRPAPAPSSTSRAVLKVRGGVVEELGFADDALTSSGKKQSILMRSFH